MGATNQHGTVRRPTQPVVGGGHNFGKSPPVAERSQPSAAGAGRQATASPHHGNVNVTSGRGRKGHHLACHYQKARAARGRGQAQLREVPAQRRAIATIRGRSCATSYGVPPILGPLSRPAEEATGATTWCGTVRRPAQPDVNFSKEDDTGACNNDRFCVIVVVKVKITRDTVQLVKD